MKTVIRKVFQTAVLVVFSLSFFINPSSVQATWPFQEGKEIKVAPDHFEIKFNVTCKDANKNDEKFQGAEVVLVRRDDDWTGLGGDVYPWPHEKYGPKDGKEYKATIDEKGEGLIDFSFEENKFFTGVYFWKLRYNGKWVKDDSAGNKDSKKDYSDFTRGALDAGPRGWFGGWLGRSTFANVVDINPDAVAGGHKFGGFSCPDDFKQQAAEIKGTVSLTCGEKKDAAVGQDVSLVRAYGQAQRERVWSGKTGNDGKVNFNYKMPPDLLSKGESRYNLEVGTIQGKDPVSDPSRAVVNQEPVAKIENGQATNLLKKDPVAFHYPVCPAGGLGQLSQDLQNKIKGLIDSIKANLGGIAECGTSDACKNAISKCVDSSNVIIQALIAQVTSLPHDEKALQTALDKCKDAGTAALSGSQPDAKIKEQLDKFKTGLINVAKCKEAANAEACKSTINSCVDSSETLKQIAGKMVAGTYKDDSEDGVTYRKAYNECQAKGEAAGKGQPAGSGAPGGPGGGSKTQVDTTTEASIHGFETRKDDAGFTQQDINWISVGSRTWPTGNEGECVNTSIDMKLFKIRDEKDNVINPPKEIKISYTAVDVGNKLKETGEKIWRNCWSYKADLSTGMPRKGTYQLQTSFAGSSAFKPSSSSVDVTYGDKQATVTKTKVKVSGSSQRTSSVKSTLGKVAFKTLFEKKSKGQVAGVMVQQQGGQTKLLNTAGIGDESIILTPESSIGEGACNQTELPTVHLTVTKVRNDGNVDLIYDNPQYPNCEPYIVSVADLGSLEQVNRLEATAVLPDNSDGGYGASEGKMVVAVASDTVKAKPYVKLSSNPSIENISAGSQTVTIIASTNRVVEDPTFVVVRKGQRATVPASLSTKNCKDGMGNCEYSFNLYYLDGDYEISFSVEDISDTLTFSTNSERKGEITGVGLIVNGQEVPMSLDGDMLDLYLDRSGSNNFLLVVHYSDGSQSRKNLAFNYSAQGGGGCPFSSDNCVYSQGNQCYSGITSNTSTCNWVNGTCVNPGAECQYSCGPVDCPTSSGSENKDCPESGDLPYSQCAGSTGLEDEKYIRGHAYEITKLTNCKGEVRYVTIDAGERVDCGGSQDVPITATPSPISTPWETPSSNDCPETKDQPYSQCGGTVGLEDQKYDRTHVYEITKITNCRGEVTYAAQDAGPSSACATQGAGNNPFAGKPYWECKNNNIIEIGPDGSKREHTICGDLEPKGTWYCDKIFTEGYRSDADCFYKPGGF